MNKIKRLRRVPCRLLCAAVGKVERGFNLVLLQAGTVPKYHEVDSSFRFEAGGVPVALVRRPWFLVDILGIYVRAIQLGGLVLCCAYDSIAVERVRWYTAATTSEAANLSLRSILRSKGPF